MNIIINNSPIEKRAFQGHEIYIKRDDLLHPSFSGNKARKFWHFLKQDYPHIKKVISYGSSQSNAMYSLSVLAKIKEWEFDYYTSHLSDYLKENLHGNFKYALENGMNLIVDEEKPHKTSNKEILFIEEGGRDFFAEEGLKVLANEILEWKEKHNIKELNIFLPSGTGTTALYLQKNIIDKVYTVPCVGDSDYLKKQFYMLEEDEQYHPNILEPSKKRHFGKLYKESYNIWLKLRQEMGVEFDLLYDPIGWITLLENPQILDKPLLYIHQGGLIGNESMLPRYERKYK
ncbi:MAG: 1-aminocyclopropane-1-carboxylate deaminase/D-cysteine desulfhydrase [Sulfurovaceae bacterium]|nr:1-aminocyclopropane-1-carboxylate deaminase/D-cysteine desulfhydrase [Sulfurovaceae bacterium]